MVFDAFRGLGSRVGVLFEKRPSMGKRKAINLQVAVTAHSSGEVLTAKRRNCPDLLFAAPPLAVNEKTLFIAFHMSKASIS